MEFPADLRLPLRSLLPFAGSSSKTRAIRSIFRFSPPKFASTKLSPPPQKATGPDPIGTRSFFATNLWFFLTLDPPSTGDQDPKTDDFILTPATDHLRSYSAAAVARTVQTVLPAQSPAGSACKAPAKALLRPTESQPTSPILQYEGSLCPAARSPLLQPFAQSAARARSCGPSATARQPR